MQAPVALDADGVMVDFLKGFEQALLLLRGEPTHRQTTDWDLATAYGLSPTEHDEAWRIFDANRFIAELPPMPGAVEAIHALHEAGHPIHVVTAVQPRYLADRKHNFKQLGLPITYTHATGRNDTLTPHSASKQAVLRQLKPVVFVDDQLLHLNQAPFVPHRVWVRNTDQQFPQPGGAEPTHVVGSLHEFVSAWLP